MKRMSGTRGLGAALVTVGAMLAWGGGTAYATEQKELPLHQTTPIVAKDFQPEDQEQCPGVSADKDGWHFVIPENHVEFVELRVTFEPGGSQTITTFGPPTAQHAYASSDPGAELTAASATVKGESGYLAKVEWFNLSHTCPGTPGSTPSPTPSLSVTPGVTPSVTPSMTIPASPSPSPSSGQPGGAVSPTVSPAPTSSEESTESPAPVAGIGGSLPITGAPALTLAGIAAALILGGTGALIVVRRRRATAEAGNEAGNQG